MKMAECNDDDDKKNKNNQKKQYNTFYESSRPWFHLGRERGKFKLQMCNSQSGISRIEGFVMTLSKLSYPSYRKTAITQMYVWV